MKKQTVFHNNDIAIIGMAGRFPGASNIKHFWNNILNKTESISFFNDSELINAGICADILHNKDYIKAKGVLSGASLFDASFFNLTKYEAETLDPQHRIFLEVAWEALENASYTTENESIKIGVFAGSTNRNTYYINNLLKFAKNRIQNDDFGIFTRNSSDFLATLVAYKLNLTGPCLNIQTACSTSLVAICQACENLLNNRCDIALAGGVTITVPLKSGYIYRPGMMLSSDGHCRTFDEKADGTVVGNGVGILVLKRLQDAEKDKDFIHAIIKGFSVNNDGQNKIGFHAPSISGQQKVIQDAIKRANIDPSMISYIETHGTGTQLGDAVEIKSLTNVFNNPQNKISKKSIALGAVKPNIGHLDVAAGVVGCIKAIEALKFRILPPNIHYKQPNPSLNLATTPFYINTEATPWHTSFRRYAGISSFGIGGTNAHLILQDAPSQSLTGKPKDLPVLLVLSAKRLSILIKSRRKLSEYLQQNSEINLQNVAFTLQKGRTHFNTRYACICYSAKEAMEKLQKVEDRNGTEYGLKILQNRKNTLSQQLYLLANDWLSSKPVNWDKLYEERPYKIPLPTYPFESREYWIYPETNTNNVKCHPNRKEIKKTKVTKQLLTEQITAIFKNFLGTDEIQSSDDFYNFGGDSLLTLQVIAEINTLPGINISPDILLKYSSATSLAEYITTNEQH